MEVGGERGARPAPPPQRVQRQQELVGVAAALLLPVCEGRLQRTGVLWGGEEDGVHRADRGELGSRDDQGP